VNGAEVVAAYGAESAEHAALRATAGVFDLSFRSRLCLVGADRVRFLHGQVTNDVKQLRVGAGCYAALTTAKGKMQSDLNVLCLPDELLLDFEPGLTATVAQRIEKFIVADDVQVVDVAPHYGLLSVQGPRAEVVVQALGFFPDIPAARLSSVKLADSNLGEIYLASHARLSLAPEVQGFDLFVPVNALGAVADKLIAAAKNIGGCPCGWTAFEAARIEAGIPRFGTDMDETNLPLECGIESRAISYHKGCYIGQEVINRIHSIGHVNRELRHLCLAEDLKALPLKGDKLFHADKEVGHITSAAFSPVARSNFALGYVRREAGATGTKLQLRASGEESQAIVFDLPSGD
jgi:aminomethyltransferase